MRGDLNKDGKIGLADVNYLLNYIAGKENYSVSLLDGDLNGDSKIALSDVNYLLKYIANDPNYPINQTPIIDINQDVEKFPGLINHNVNFSSNMYDVTIKASNIWYLGNITPNLLYLQFVKKLSKLQNEVYVLYYNKDSKKYLMEKLQGAKFEIGITTTNYNITDMILIEEDQLLFLSDNKFYYKNKENIIEIYKFNENENVKKFSVSWDKTKIYFINKINDSLIEFDISLNNNLSNKKEINILKNFYKKLENLRYFEIDNLKYLIVLNNSKKYGIIIINLETYEIKYLNTPKNFKYIDLTINDNNNLIVGNNKYIYKVNLINYLDRMPKFINNNYLTNFGKNLKVKVLVTGLTRTRNLIINKHNDIIALVRDYGIVVFRVGDYKNNDFNTLTLENGYLIGGKPNDLIQLGAKANQVLNHAIAIFNFEKYNKKYIFSTSEDDLFAWEYSDETLESSIDFLKNGKRIISNINNGTETEIVRQGGNHKTREIVFDKNGNLFIQVGSYSNIDDTAARAQVRKLDKDKLIKILFKNEEIIEYKDLETWALGLRNIIGMSLGPNNEVWGVNASSDNLVPPSDITDPVDGIFKDRNPACGIYKLKEENKTKKIGYGYPYAWSSATKLIRNGNIEVAENTLFEYNRSDGYTREYIRNPNNCVQKADQVLPAHTTPMAITFNFADENNNIIYDGKCDHTITKKKSINNDFAIVSLHGSWNASKPVGYSIVSMDLNNNNKIEDFYNDESFSKNGTTNYGSNGNLTYRPTGVIMDVNGSIISGSDPTINYQPGQILVFYE